MPRLMERQLDARAAALLKAAVQSKGVEVVLEAQTAAIEGDGKVERVVLKDGRTFPADLVVMAAGIRPETTLAESGGLETGRGIKVDDKLETNWPGVYAIGECAEHRGACYGVVEPVYEQAKVLARYLAGHARALRGLDDGREPEGVGRPCLLHGRLRGRRTPRPSCWRTKAPPATASSWSATTAWSASCCSAIPRTRSGIATWCATARRSRRCGLRSPSAGPMRRPPSVMIEKSASSRWARFGSGFLDLNHTRIMTLLVSFRSRNSFRRLPRAATNFAIRTLGNERARLHRRAAPLPGRLRRRRAGAPRVPGPEAAGRRGGGAGPAAPAGPDKDHLAAMARFEAAGKKLSAEEKAKRDEHPFDAYARFKSESAKGQFPKGIDNFRWRFHGLFYVAPTQNSYMCRLRIPNGILSHWQFAGVADLAERYGGGYAHVTTRANLQIRDMMPDGAVPLIEGLTEPRHHHQGDGRRQHPQRHRLAHGRHRPAGAARHPSPRQRLAPPHPERPLALRPAAQVQRRLRRRRRHSRAGGHQRHRLHGGDGGRRRGRGRLAFGIASASAASRGTRTSPSTATSM